MAYIPNLTNNYVKFIRGTTTAWANIKEKNDDTLYFIYENSSSDRGKLYLGAKLISDGTININNIGDLQDIVLSSGIADQSLLVYNSASGTWQDKPLGTVLSALVDIMQAATETDNGVEGLVPAPKAGEQDLFLRGDATWANPTAELEQTLQTFENSVDLKFIQLMAGDTGSIRKIAKDEVAKIVASAPEAYDTLKEIADWISDHDAAVNVATLENRIGDLEDAVLGTSAVMDEEGNEVITPAVPGLVDIVTGLQEVVNDPASGLVVRMNQVELKTITLAGEVSQMKKDQKTLSEKVTSIDERLCWNELIEESELSTD